MSNLFPEGGKEALELIDQANSLLTSPIANEIVKGALKDISSDLVTYIDKPEAYFKEKADKVADIEAHE